jgi:pyruvate dehydrogenase E2 component (dihydrolipoamide acetyltransferase)
MPFTLTMPKLSPTMEEGTVTKWRKKEGEFVRSDEVLLEVATDKATVEHTALDEGFLRKILVQEGASAIVNQPLAVFSLSKDEDISSYQPEGVVPAASVEEKKQEENPSQRPETKTEVVTTGMKQPAFIPEAPLEKDEFAFPTEPADFIKASPYAKKIAKEQGIDLSTVKGTGPHQRIVSKDLELGQKRGAFVFGVQRRPELVAGSYEEEALSPMRKTLAQRLQQS